MEETSVKIPTDRELRDLILKCNGNPDKLVFLFNHYAALILQIITDQVAERLTNDKKDVE